MRKEWWCLDTLIGITIILILIYAWKPVVESESIYQVVQKRWRHAPVHYKKVKTILYWNTMYAEKHTDFMLGIGDIFKNCPVSYCYATPNRKLLTSIHDFDAILFHGIEMHLDDLPNFRTHDQRYIFFSWESPLSRPINDFQFVMHPGYYNWTMSYRLDSDIRRPYGQIRDIGTKKLIAPPSRRNEIVKWKRRKKLYVPTEKEMLIIMGKSKIAAWFVSHCKTNSQREVLVRELQKYFEVDVYGKCGDMHCDKNNPDKCYDLLEKDYFFYLSFENTLCNDYVTEKFFFPMQKYVIPVVYGGAEYSKFAPPHSYINIKDFNNVRELAKFMLKLSKNEVEYASYFWWKKFYTIEDTREKALCDLCEILHDISMPRKSVDDFEKYYNSGECINGNITNFIGNEYLTEINNY
ncbi:alpha-(1,3)-fucosyltransferase C-like [Chelonus insularis]|uniref:alpha-(1,3)-fucosyltransferase C-like n=1 Tax=Chelonus insularis TaxID=460826 RepID=UPI0015888A70|nr:alpha-(1,3)-fucosyltransferase C-like [Chelonus insularis]